MFELLYAFDKQASERYVYAIDYSELKKALRTIISDEEIERVEELTDDGLDVLLDTYREVVTKYYEKDAKEQYLDDLEYKKSPDAYFGVNRRD